MKDKNYVKYQLMVYLRDTIWYKKPFVYLELKWLDIKSFAHNSTKGLRIRYYKLTNKTQREALDWLDRADTNGFYLCPECGKTFKNDKLFEDHINVFHGYPRDMDIIRFYTSDSPTPTTYGGVTKANPEYLKYL